MELLIKILSRLSLKSLYRLSDYVVYPIMYHVVRYRRGITRKNLTRSFPDKSIREITALEKRFYHHFADVLMEIIWNYRATNEEVMEHFIFENVADVEQWAKEKQGVIYMLGHMGNWEWLPAVQLYYTDKELQEYNVYRRLKNETANRLILNMREKRSGANTSIEKNDLVRRMIAMSHTDKRFTLGLISDQKVSPKNAYHWTDFLHQDTSFLGGGEVLARKMDWAVAYIHITETARGYYRVRFELLTLDAPHTEKGEITEKFARVLEANILEQPHLWLWTHNRWKWKREDR
ncbi:MAG: lysophospholipid acyltransferase family protein [Paludibacteraceae bacterium]|nr:lysophospholipid acyltransferase family protein [Paludibacteraceae bacterium]